MSCKVKVRLCHILVSKPVLDSDNASTGRKQEVVEARKVSSNITQCVIWPFVLIGAFYALSFTFPDLFFSRTFTLDGLSKSHALSA